ncbi:hypothetical protein MAIT1_00265 [Magnetofaba australis IT-1]|uniref:Uncharacterized protein n=1 Tax=Magnetofaba australis IT-1 TaxID=1434232 RepID=A0A1Y2K7Y9_9PROT|nr:hypothetical protein MAIT1_00265 [Magnetofaba australis IT-1]
MVAGALEQIQRGVDADAGGGCGQAREETPVAATGVQQHAWGALLQAGLQRVDFGFVVVDAKGVAVAFHLLVIQRGLFGAVPVALELVLHMVAIDPGDEHGDLLDHWIARAAACACEAVLLLADGHIAAAGGAGQKAQ